MLPSAPLVLTAPRARSLAAAMEAEAQPMIESLRLKLDDPPVIAPPAPCLSYSGEDFGAKIHLVCFGELAQAPRPPVCLPLTRPCSLRAHPPSPPPRRTLPPARLHARPRPLPAAGKCKSMGVDHIGTVPAALTTYLAIQAFRPDVVISAGTCGGFAARGAAIADVFVSTRMVNHDRRIPLPVRGMGVCVCV